MMPCHISVERCRPVATPPAAAPAKTSAAAWAAAAAALLAAGTLAAQTPMLQFTQVAETVSVVDIRNAGDGSGRLFLVEQSGSVRILQDGALRPTPYLELDDITTGGERGLLSIAFAPDYADSGYFYAWYTDPAGDTVLAQFQVSSDPDRADLNSEEVLLLIEQPFPNHNGGRLAFGQDGMLYLSTGDGGSANDPQDNAQDLNSLLGKILRLRVRPEPGTYEVPADNPFVGVPNARPEIWAFGLRNPWRISFDAATHDLFIADVGQDAREEINFQPSGSNGGENYGWDLLEGTLCLQQPECNEPQFTPPVFEYSHDPHCSVTGGEVYRGGAYPNLHGRYLFGDYCSGTIWSLRRQGLGFVGNVLIDTSFEILTFGLGEDRSLYVSSRGDGVYLVSDGAVVPEPDFMIHAGLNDAWFNPATNGQGFFITVFPNIGQIFLAWFTYDVERPPQNVTAMLGEPGHRWLTAFGSYSGNRAELDIEMTSGGVFDSPTPPVTQQTNGTITLEFSDCEHGTVSYDIDSLDLRGAVPIQRIAPDNVAYCESL